MKGKFFLHLILLLSFIANGQVTTSKIKGTVTDNTGEPLLGANVVVLHEPTGTVSGSVANENGKYTIPNLRVGGPYKITFSFVGFKSQEITNIFLTLGKTTSIDGVLSEDGEQLQEVVISTSKSKLFNNDRTGAQTSVSAQQLKTLPTISRSAQDFTRLEPTASGGSFGGRNDQFNNFSLDGSIFNNPFGLDAATPGGQTGAQPISLDAIEQISVSVAPYDVTQSGFTGASVDAVTKSGTNEFKGTFYGFFRNQDFTGGKVRGEDVFKSKLSQTQFGASIGGPIIKDKLFFFTNIETDNRTDLGQSWVANRGTGAINESRVKASDLEAVSNALKKLGYDTGAYESFNHNSASIKGIFKLDWNINNNHRLAFIHNFLHAYQQHPAHPTALGRRGPSYSTLQFQNSGYTMNNRIKSYLIELNSTFSENITNKLQVGYTKFEDFRNPLSAPVPSILIQDGEGSNYIVVGHEPFSINNTLDQRVFQVTNNMNYFTGNHTITLGASFEKFMFDISFNLGAYGGTFGFDINNTPTDFTDDRNFSSVAEFLVKAQPGGFVDKLIRQAEQTYYNRSKYSVGNKKGWSLAETNVGQLAFYLQDEWEISESFKVSGGVRFDKPLYFDTKDKIQDNIDRKGTYKPEIDYYNPNTESLTKLSSLDLPSNNWLISPRLGFNWNVNGESKIQVRGGTGLFTGRLPFVWIGNQVQGVDDYFYQIVDKDFKFPQVWRTSFGVDYKFENGLVATVDASYTKDIQGTHVQNWGLKKPTTVLQGVDNRLIYGDSDKTKGNAYVLTNSDKGRAINASLKLQKTFEKGLYTSIAYNYLDSKDVNSIEAEITGDAFKFNPALGNVNDDVLSFSKYGDIHRVVGVISKKFTYGTNDKWATSVATFFEYAKGGRFSYTYAGDINNDGSGINDLVYVPTDSEIDGMPFTVDSKFSEQEQRDALKKYINQDDYLSSRRGKYAERYGALAPWRSRWDVKLLQDFNFETAGRKNTIQLSVDILNAGNLVNSDWGVVQQPNNVQPIGVKVDKTTNEAVYSFDPKQKETFGYDSSLQSRWQMQVGLRYIF